MVYSLIHSVLLSYCRLHLMEHDVLEANTGQSSALGDSEMGRIGESMLLPTGAIV